MASDRTRRSVLYLRGLAAEALAGIVRRPGRSALAALGTVLGVGASVAVLGLTSTANGQISKTFDELTATTVVVTDAGDGRAHNQDNPARVSFPADADHKIAGLNGAVAGGVFWTVPLAHPVIGASPVVGATSAANASDLPVYAASAGLLTAAGPLLRSGSLFNAFHDERGERVAVLGADAATRLGISQVVNRPAVFINGTAFTVVGIVEDTARVPELLLGVILPRGTAERLYPAPDPAVSPAQMVIETQMGAAQLIARQTPVALRPDNPQFLRAEPPPDPRTMRDSVKTDGSALFLLLAAICLVIGAAGIAGTTLVATWERVGEIGLRRALGARRRHVTAQFLTEAAALGALGGVIGTALGVATVVLVAVVNQWTAVLDPMTVLPAPLVGAATGLLAGCYPALRAATVNPVEALRR
ncbi:ABC transporter permease [Phytohabitans flavus]|uniref:ABC transporter permease n=1 Tax=Phytohabitans flavus TaxID=1076124 RepID=A0A6F8Y7V7_9ACTN|nr:ABC transporter permease [Phytohabitans flavus]BCB82068.1 ABC transporter permease [Phytohabitans flavus]